MSTHKRLCAMGAIAAVTTVLAACGGGGSSSDEKSLTVTMWGGTAQEAHVDSYVKPWAEEAGVEVQQDSPTDYAKLKAQVEADNVSWGVVEVEPNFAKSACDDGLLTKLPDNVLDAAKKAKIAPEQMGECSIPNLQYAFTIGYNTDEFGDNHPKTWEEFFDTEKFPGKRAFWKSATGGIFEAALLADGVAPKDLYPLDIDRAFDKLDTIKDDIVFYDTGDQMTQMLASGEAPLIQAWNGRISEAAEAGEPVANEWNQHFITYDQVAIPKGYANTDLAQDWMEWFLTNPKAQAKDAEASGYGPASPTAMEYVPEEAAKSLPAHESHESQSALTVDYDYWAENYDKVTEELNAWMAQ